MKNESRKKVTHEDGLVYSIDIAVGTSASGAENAITTSEEIREKAQKLLPMAQAMAQARTNRLLFIRVSGKSLQVGESNVCLAAEVALQESKDRVECLQLLVAGNTNDSRRIVTIEDWRHLLEFFKQDTSLGFHQNNSGVT